MQQVDMARSTPTVAIKIHGFMSREQKSPLVFRVGEDKESPEEDCVYFSGRKEAVDYCTAAGLPVANIIRHGENIIREDFVRYSPVGKEDCSIIEERVKRFSDLVPNDNPHDIVLDIAYQMQAAVMPAYEAWKTGHTLGDSGTPLLMLFSEKETSVIRSAGITSIEMLASAPDSLIGKILLPRPDDIRTKAMHWLGTRHSNHASAEVEAMRKENADLRVKLDRMFDMIVSMQGGQPNIQPIMVPGAMIPGVEMKAPEPTMTPQARAAITKKMRAEQDAREAAKAAVIARQSVDDDEEGAGDEPGRPAASGDLTL
jgi:hypothetical protein